MGVGHSFGNFCLWHLLLLAVLLPGSCRNTRQPVLTIATAANAQFAITAIAKKFTAETGIKTRVLISSSGKHTAQIKAGAPYDIFISADLQYPETLHKEGLTTGQPAVYAYGKLILWTLNDSLNLSLSQLPQQNIRHLALPNPKTAPYGRAAAEALQQAGIYQALAPKLVYGESVGQANQFILSGAAEAGFSAAAIVLAPAMKGKGRWQPVADSLYSPIAQGAVVLKQSPYPELADKFFLFLFSPAAKEILQAYGYVINNQG